MNTVKYANCKNDAFNAFNLTSLNIMLHVTYKVPYHPTIHIHKG